MQTKSVWLVDSVFHMLGGQVKFLRGIVLGNSITDVPYQV